MWYLNLNIIQIIIAMIAFKSVLAAGVEYLRKKPDLKNLWWYIKFYSDTEKKTVKISEFPHAV